MFLKVQNGKMEEQKSAFKWFICRIFYYPSLGLIIIGSLFIKLADLFMSDTHHFELRVVPKDKDSIKNLNK